VNPVVTGWVRDELHQLAEPRQPHPDQDHARHHPGDQQAGDAVLLHDRQEDHDERRGRPGDLDPGAAEQRADDAGDDRGVEAVLRRHPGGDRERHRQRQRDHADHQAGHQVGAKVGARVALLEALPQPVGELILDAERERELVADRLGQLLDVTDPHRAALG
jgi:hypothetical protein